MNTLQLFLEAAWKVLVWSMLLGAGLLVVFTMGVRALAPAAESADGDAVTAEHDVERRPMAVVVAGVCFLIVVAGVGLGLTYIVASGQGKVLSFDHGYPTLVPK